MTKRAQQITSIFHSAIAREGSERRAFLDGACADDSELRREVESLIESHERAGSFIDAPAPAYERRAELLQDEQQSELAGTTLGRYRIVSLLGAGGMGEVYLAEDTQLGRQLAVKVLTRRLTEDSAIVMRFRQEARAASALNHPNIVTIYEVGEADGTHFIATEFVEGVTLRELMAHTTLEVSKALEIAAQVAAALVKAHGAGVVHRDIKPENVMVNADGHAKVLDFGIAKLTEQARAGAMEAATVLKVETSPGAVMGTAHYMSPEQARGVVVDSRTDIFSLGVVLYEMLAGRQPFEGKTATDVMSSILNKEPPPLARYNREVTEALDLVVQKALGKDRDERYQTAKELQADLRRVRQRIETGATAAVDERSSEARTLTHENQDGRGTDDVGATPTDKATQIHTTSSAEYIVTEIKRHKLGAVIALVVLLLVGTVAIFAIYRFTGREKTARLVFEKAEVTRVTTSGMAHDANISPDGKYVVYLEMADDGSRGFWVKQIASGNAIPIVPPTKGNILKKSSFSPDGNFVYYVFSDRTTPEALYSVSSIGGGVPKRVVANCDSPAAFSPDGKNIAFMRWADAKSNVVVANLDGTAERVVATKEGTEWFGGRGMAWSPDGKTIACVSGISTGNGDEHRLLGIDAQTGAARELSPQKWIDAGRVVWMPDGKTLVLIAMERIEDGRYQMWRVSHPEGVATRVTNDVHGYDDMSLGVTADGRTLVTGVEQERSRIETLPAGGDTNRLVRLTTSEANQEGLQGLAWTPDGRIVFSSFEGTQSNIWIMHADGSNRRRLTADTYIDIDPAVSPDGRYVVFASNRPTGQNIPFLWRMDIDGGNLTLLTRKDGWSPNISPDGRWVIYASRPIASEGWSLWKVSIDGGEPVRLTDYSAELPSYSPDGQWIAFIAYENGSPSNAIIPVSGGVKPEKSFSFPGFQYQYMRWVPDGKTLSFIGAPPDPSNIWLQPVEGGDSRQLTNFKTEYIFRHAWSPDGKVLALARGRSLADVVLLKDVGQGAR